ncbi:zinc containing alcohol dehydrogenase superfamily protein [Baekduia alba]|uniref:zinc-dependent alcohol dehydrogenase n=1 Tax=Baekduia alba TaxID=2997333 RepID=UPI002340DAAA|nr:zinc-binding alcohol dehydrogenase [Baekduia alba]WCB95945.1 zinc containing alcohol dehydrogenase superfamily protein [Baekduia alba]
MSIATNNATVVRFTEALSAELVTDPDDRANRALEPDQVRLETLYSGISAGTELTAYRGSNPYLTKHWNEDTRLFEPASAPSFQYPIDGWGYEEVGRIVEVGSAVTKVSAGDVVYGAWGHRSHHIGTEAWAADRVLPEGLDPIVGIFSQIGAIALNGVLDADVHVGEDVAVFGQGVPGLLCGQLVTANGGDLIAVDAIARRLELATELGARHALNVTDGEVAERIKQITGSGADVSIEISGFAGALQEAIRATAYNSRVIAAGFFQGGADALLLGEEFHHNRISVICSQISGVSRALDHRWSELRLAQTFMRLCAEGRVKAEPLVSHRFAAEQAGEAFTLLHEQPAECVQVVLDFTGGAA